ncbi:MAG: sugar phosphate isomerase/epimerase [Clostridiales bacterium]|jgi:sugar phosphate isomerase/epimerase|nr:sugar phosphate isomerase/epimerase [Clostridiales bacterium]
MRFGICSGYERAEIIKKGGFDYLEGNLGSISKMTVKELKEAESVLSGNGLKYESTNCFFPGEIKIVGDEFDINKIKDYTHTALEKAASLGVVTCVLGSGGSRRMPEGYCADKANEQMLEALFAVGDIAKDYFVTIAIEPLNSRETNTLNTVAEVYDFCMKLSHPNVKVLADLYHVFVENEPMSVIERCGDMLYHIHFSNPVLRAWPKPEDEYDYAPFAAALKKISYNNRISIEAGSKDVNAEIGPALETMKKYFL